MKIHNFHNFHEKFAVLVEPLSCICDMTYHILYHIESEIGLSLNGTDNLIFDKLTGMLPQYMYV